MSLQKAYAAVLQLVRTKRGLTQIDTAVTVTQSHISRLEALKTSATLEVSQALASALNLQLVSFVTLVQAAQDQKSAREILQAALQELEAMDLLDERLPAEPRKLPSPKTEGAEDRWKAVQALKIKGHTQVEIVRILGMPRSTVGRLWQDKKLHSNEL